MILSYTINNNSNSFQKILNFVMMRALSRKNSKFKNQMSKRSKFKSKFQNKRNNLNKYKKVKFKKKINKNI